MINLETIVSYRSDLDTTDLDGDKVMMDLEKGQYFALNSVGSRVWEEIESPIKISSIVDKLLGEYEVDRATCEESVMEFIETLDNAGLLSKEF
ncbi:lasso peptide biosynthesis PqqD family chaperone [Romboutsia sp.]|uniref:lasso peptide biosynthesis PqqD family chaperone n=1 Tax=Romboutsia sp. TaxID=1965302 RepID=UPI003F39AAFF